MQFHVVGLCLLEFVDMFQCWLKSDKKKTVRVTTYVLDCVKFQSLFLWYPPELRGLLRACLLTCTSYASVTVREEERRVCVCVCVF